MTDTIQAYSRKRTISTGVRLLIVTQAVDKNHPVLGFFHRWIEEFAKHFERIEVICLLEGEHSLPENVRVHSLGKEKGEVSKVVYSWRFLRLIWKLRSEYDAVFVHMNQEYVLLGGLLWRALRKSVSLWYTHRSVTPSLRLAVFFVKNVYTASKESFRLTSQKVRVMGHGIDSDLFSDLKINKQGLSLITVGRISSSKRIVQMLAVLDELQRRGIECTFTIVGGPATREDESYNSLLKEQIARHSYSGHIRLLGSVPHKQLPLILSEASIFLHMSTTGSVDKAVLEALAAGLAVVTTSEAFEGAPVVHSSDTPAALCGAILTAQTTDAQKGRTYVRSQHSLSELIRCISADISV